MDIFVLCFIHKLDVRNVVTKMELNKYVGNKIKQLRISRSITQDSLADKLGTTRQTISRYENGDRKVNQDVLFALSKILNVKVDDFFPSRNEDDSEPTNAELIAAHIDDNVTSKQMDDILHYIELVRRANNDK